MMNPNDAKPIFSFIPKPYVKESPAFDEPKEEELPVSVSPVYQTQKVVAPTQEKPQQQSIETLIAKIDSLEILLLQKQSNPEKQTNEQDKEEIVNHLRANNLQMAKLAKEIRQLDAQRSVADTSSEIESVIGQIRSTNLHLSKIDRKIEYLLHAISAMQEKEQMNNSEDVSYQPRSQGLLLAKLERKMNELLYHYNNQK
jgi:septal ring factor EnvC (AmiA/AmiB activator)